MTGKTRRVQVRSRRGGFTRMEQLVATASFVVTATVIAPGVLAQIDKAEVSRMLQDLLAVEKSAKTFRADVAYWPGELLQLIEALEDGDVDAFDNDILSTVFANWQGPYFEPRAFVDHPTDTTQVLASAAGTYFTNELDDYTFASDSASTAAPFFAIELNEVSRGDAKKISFAIDGEELVEASGDVYKADSLGRVRWTTTETNTVTDGTKGTLIYFAGPID